jgi:hypothetical protein
MRPVFTALALVLCPLTMRPQEERIAVLIEQLGNDDIDIRESARQQLVQMGEVARAALVKATHSVDPEVARRVRAILGEILLLQTRDRFLGPAWRVSVPQAERSLAEIADLLNKQTSANLLLPTKVLKDRIAIGAESTSFWEFIDRVCERHGRLRVATEQREGKVRLEEGLPESKGSVHTFGQFRIWIERIRLERGGPFEQPGSRAAMVLAATWQPNVSPIGDLDSPESLQVTRILSSDGKALETKSPPWWNDSLYRGFSGSREYPRVYRRFIPFEPPGPGIKRLEALEGHLDLLFPQKYETLTFEIPRTPIGATQRIGPFAFSLTTWKAGTHETTVELRVSLPKEPAEIYKQEIRVGLQSRIISEEITMAGNPGEACKCSRYRAAHQGEDTREAVDLELHFPVSANQGAISVRFVTEYFVRRVEFRFKDVELP